MLAQGAGFIPIVGARKVARVQGSLGAVDVTLPPQALLRLDGLGKVPLGFPHHFLRSTVVQDMVKTETRARLLERPAR